MVVASETATAYPCRARIRVIGEVWPSALEEIEGIRVGVGFTEKGVAGDGETEELEVDREPWL